MLVDKRPRVKLAHLPTPLEQMENLAKELNTNVNLWVKRDDCTGGHPTIFAYPELIEGR